MSLSLTIASVDRTTNFYLPDGQRGIVSGTIMPGAKSSLRLNVYDLNGPTGYRPNINDTIALMDGATTVFAGLIDEVDEAPVPQAIDGNMDTGVLTQITASDWWAYFDRVTYTQSYPIGTTLKAILTDLVANPLNPFGITLDPAQVTGPSLTTVFQVVKQTPSQIVSQLTTLTGYVGIVLPTKAFRMTAPASESCGYALGDSLPGTMGQVTSKQSRNTNYANRIVLTCGDTSTKQTTETYTAVGGDTQFVTVYPASLDFAGVWPNELIVNGSNLGPVDWRPNGAAGILPGHHWYWDAVNHKLVVDNVAYTPVAGDVITITYTIQYPFEVTYTDPSITNPADIVEADVSNTSIFDMAAGLAYAQGLVRQRIANPQMIYVRNNLGVAYPGLSVVLTFADHAISGTCLITQVDFQDAEDGTMEYALTCVPGSELNGSWLDFWKNFFGGGSGASTSTTGSISGGATGTTGVGTSVPGGSDTDVQFNDDGSFGGDDNFTYNKTTHCLVMGKLSTITATSPESCLALGEDCHVADS